MLEVGLLRAEGLVLLRRIVETRNVVGFDVVELATEVARGRIDWPRELRGPLF